MTTKTGATLLKIAAALALSAASGSPSPARELPAAAAASRSAIAARELMETLEGVGFSGGVLLARGDEVILRKAYGSAFDAGGQRATTETVFDLGSITKQFTAASILLLEQEGKLRTADPIGRYVDGLPAEKAALTLHQLLTHTSGLGDAHGGDHEAVDKAEALKRIAAQKLRFPPGSSFSYSNSGYTLLAAVIERVSGMSYIDFVRRRLFVPAGMTSTGFYNEPLWSGRAVFHGYANGEDTGDVARMPGPFWTVIGNGEALSTLDDMRAWIRFLHGGKLLKASQLAKMTKGYVSRTSGGRWGYAMQMYDFPIGLALGHGGVGDGGNSEAYYVPQHDLVMVLHSNRTVMREMKNPDGLVVQLPARAARDALAKVLAGTLKS